jgi:hypothetical protein
MSEVAAEKQGSMRIVDRASSNNQLTGQSTLSPEDGSRTRRSRWSSGGCCGKNFNTLSEGSANSIKKSAPSDWIRRGRVPEGVIGMTSFTCQG